jgi:hypothetical protein
MGEACRKIEREGEMKNYYNIVVGIPGCKISPERPTRRCGDNIKIDLEEIG